MLTTVLATARLLRRVVRALGDPATRGVVVLAALTLLSGTIFYTTVEGWRVLDAVTLTTIGYGDLVPSSDLAKAFTMVYSLTGIGVIATFVAALATATRRDGDDDGGTAVVEGHPEGPSAA